MRFTALTLSGLALILFACSSEAPSGSVKGTSTPAPVAGDDDADDESQSPRSGETGTSANADATDPAPAGGQCGSQAKAKACFACCDPSKNAFEAAHKSFGDCICGAAKCATQCAQTFCNANPSEPQQGDACDTCLAQHVEACDQGAAEVCEKDASCKKAAECVETAKCYDKPE